MLFAIPLIYFSLFPEPVSAQATAQEDSLSIESPQEARQFPKYLALADDLNRFGQFADGGSDSNWYIGFNNAWIVKLPPSPKDSYCRAYLGAKIGRAKTEPKPERPWELSVLQGKIYMAVSQKPAFSPEQTFFLVDAQDLPLEPHASLYLSGFGKSEWFWAEIPPALVSSGQPNYLIVWSPTREFRDAAHSPILAGAPAQGGAEARAWNTRSLQGVPPRNEAGALEVPISNILPALALKLVSDCSSRVVLRGFTASSLGDDLLARFSVEGRDVEAAWLESSQDQLEWRRASSYLRSPPYLFTLSGDSIPPRGAYLRAKARDSLGGTGVSEEIFVSTSDVDEPR